MSIVYVFADTLAPPEISYVSSHASTSQTPLLITIWSEYAFF